MYYGCLLSYAGCTTDAGIASASLPHGALPEHFNPVMYGSPAQTMRGILRVFGRSGSIRVLRIDQVGTGRMSVARWWPVESPRTAAKAGAQRVSRRPQTNGPGNGPSSTALMLAHDSMAANAL
jgi:hypothetical protein